MAIPIPCGTVEYYSHAYDGKLSGLKACSKLEIEIKRKSVIIVKVGILVLFVSGFEIQILSFYSPSFAINE